MALQELYVVIGGDVTPLTREFAKGQKQAQVFGADIKRQAEEIEDAAYEEFAASQRLIAQKAKEAAARRANMTAAEREADAMIRSAEYNRAAQKSGIWGSKAVAEATDTLTKSTGRAAVGLNTVRAGMVSLVASSLQTAPGVAQVSGALGTMAIGAAPMIAVLAGVAAVTYGWNQMTKEARELKKATAEAMDEVERIQKMQDTQGAADIIDRNRTLRDAEVKALEKVTKAREALQQAGRMADSDPNSPSAIKNQEKALEKLTKANQEHARIKRALVSGGEQFSRHMSEKQKERDEEALARSKKLNAERLKMQVVPGGLEALGLSAEVYDRIVTKQQQLRDSIEQMRLERGIATTVGDAEELDKKLADALVKLKAISAAEVRFGVADFKTPGIAGKITDRGGNSVQRMSDMRTAGAAGVAGLDWLEQPRATESRSDVQAARDFIQSIQDAGAVVNELTPDLQAQFKSAQSTIKEYDEQQKRSAKSIAGGDGIGAKLKSVGSKIISVFNPMGMVSQVLNGAFQELGANLTPIISILGQALTPILKALYPVFKAIVIAATYVGEIFFKVSGGIAKAIGGLMVGLGKLINKLPGSIGNPLIKAGNALKVFGEGQIEAADALHDARDDIKKLKWEETADAADKVTASLESAAIAYNTNLLRYRIGMGPGAGVPAAPTANGGGGNVTVNGGVTIVAAPGDDELTLWQKFIRGAQRAAATGDPVAIHWLRGVRPVTG